MNTATSKALQEYLAHHSFMHLTDIAAAIAGALLICVLLEREVLRLVKADNIRRNVAAFNIVVLPVALMFTAVIVERFMRLS